MTRRKRGIDDTVADGLKSVFDRTVDGLVETLGPDVFQRYGTISLEGPRDEHDTVLDVPGYYQRQWYTCGFAAGLTALHTFRPRASPERFFETVPLLEGEGVAAKPLMAALRAHGIGTRVLRAHSFDRLADRIESGEPVLTHVNNGKPGNHWVVVYGVRRGREVFVAGNSGPWSKIYAWAEFARIWRPRDGAFSCWGM
jgi:hypothetical protein